MTNLTIRFDFFQITLSSQLLIFCDTMSSYTLMGSIIDRVFALYNTNCRQKI